MRRSMAAWPMLVLLVACGDSSPTQMDLGADADPGDMGIQLNLEPGDDGATNLAETLTASQVRAGRVTAADELLTGVKVEGKIGDFKIFNNKIAVIIESDRPSNGYVPFGGAILDVARVDGANPGRSLFGEMSLGLGTKVIAPQTIGVVKDGSDGNEALIRVIGLFEEIPIAASVLPGVLGPTPYWGVIDYVLKPDADSLEIRFRIFNQTNKERETPLGLGLLIGGDGVDFFSEVLGFEVGDPVKVDYVAAAGKEISYGLWSANEFTPLTTFTGAWIVSTGLLTVPPAGEVQRSMHLIVGHGEPETIRQVAQTLRGETGLSTVSGQALDPAQVALKDVRIHVVDASNGQYVTRTRTDDNGDFSVKLKDGSYRLQAWADDRDPSPLTDITVSGADLTQDLSLGATATFNFDTRDGQAVPLPAKLVFTRNPASQEAPDAYGELDYPGNAALIVFHPGGTGSVNLPPGEYTVVTSRGLEYDIDTTIVTLAEGAPVSHSVTLNREVDSVGYVCGDFHLHALFSPDSNDLYELKVKAAAAEGLEIAVTTEHDYVGDYGPTITSLGLQQFVRGIVGEELSTIAFGHFNVFPMTQRDLPNKGAIEWFKRTPEELFGKVRTEMPQAVLQINHPRGDTLSSYFSHVGFDPTDGSFELPGDWSSNFDVIEVFNSVGLDSQGAVDTLNDWFGMLDRGLRVAATGNSDSHNAFSSEIGYPRNCVMLSTDEPANVDPMEFATAVKAGKFTVNGGAFVTASIDGKTLGDVATVSAGVVSVQVRVQAPSWVALDKIEVYSGGQVGGIKLAEVDISAPSGPVIRYDGTIDVNVSGGDTWIVVTASGTSSLSPVVPGSQPFGLTNPIYLDLDGNGAYDPQFSFMLP